MNALAEVLAATRVHVAAHPQVTLIVIERGRDLEVQQIQIPDAYQGRGYGTHALDAVKAEARRRRCKVYLYPYSCYNRDADLFRFYRRNGFAPWEHDAEWWVWDN